MSNSSLVTYTKISPNSSNPRNHKIDTITIHHAAAVNQTVEALGAVFAASSRQASANYGVGSDGRVALYVEEKNRAWTSSNRDNDNRAITIEVVNDGRGPDWHVSDKALQATIDLCVDICKRNGIARLNFTGDKSGNLTLHKWFAATLCPGPYLESKMPYIAEEVNKRLGSKAPEKEETPKIETKDELYRVRKSWADSKSQIGAYATLKWAKKSADAHPGYKVFDSSGKCVYPKIKPESYLVKITADMLNVRKSPDASSQIRTTVRKNGIYTIVDEADGWGKLKSGAGWINLEYTTRV